MSNGCYIFVSDVFSTNDMGCNCSLPCMRVNYEPSLSFAQLSRLNIGRLVLQDPNEKDHVQVKFHAAMEVIQRVQTEILTADQKMMKDIIDKCMIVQAALRDGTTGTVNYTTYSALFGVADLLGEGKDYLSQLDTYINEKLTHVKDTAIVMINSDVDNIQAFWDDFLVDGSIDNMRNCLLNESIVDRTQCVNMRAFRDMDIPNVIGSLDSTERHTSKIYNAYVELDELYQNIPEFSQENRQKCGPALNWFYHGGNISIAALKEKVVELNVEIAGYLDNNDPVDYDLVISVMEQIGVLVDDADISSYVKKLEELRRYGEGHSYGDFPEELDALCVDAAVTAGVDACRCFGHDVQDDMIGVAEAIETYYSLLNTDNTRFLTFFETIQSTMKKMNISYFAEIEPLVTGVTLYESNAMKKEDLLSQYDGVLTSNAMETFLSEAASLKSIADPMGILLTGMKSHIKGLHEEFFDNKFEILSYANYNDTVLGQLLLAHRDDPYYVESFAGLESNFQESYITLQHQHFDVTDEHLSGLINKVVDGANNIIGTLAILREDLMEFKKSIMMNNDFYM